jgi:LPS-assembly lipoprotein
MIRRRGILSWILAVPLVLQGCGWTPLYADAESGPADDELRTIRVETIPERIGQRLALALRRSLNPSGVEAPKNYSLHVILTVTRADTGIQSQGLGTRGRVDVSATFTLSDLRTNTLLLNNTSHVADSFDIVANEYSTVVAEEDARNRAVEELRRDMVTKLTLFLQRRASGTA